MLDELREFEAGRPRDAPRLLVVASGDEEELRALGLRSTVALDRDAVAGAAFGARGTPMAVLLDRDGRVASGVAAGRADVVALAGAEPPLLTGVAPTAAAAR